MGFSFSSPLNLQLIEKSCPYWGMNLSFTKILGYWNLNVLLWCSYSLVLSSAFSHMVRSGLPSKTTLKITESTGSKDLDCCGFTTANSAICVLFVIVSGDSIELVTLRATYLSNFFEIE